LANETDAARLLADHSAGLGAPAWVVILALPGLYLAAWFIQWRTARYRNDESLRRRSRAYPTVKRALKAIDKEGGAEPLAATRRGARWRACWRDRFARR
jgi:hypothetical protein